MSIRIAKGLRASYKNARDYTLSQAFLELKQSSSNYEVLNPDRNRVFGDIDGKNIDLSQEEFEAKDLQTREAIEKFLSDQSYCLLSASSFLHKKISWRFVLVDKVSSLAKNKAWVVANLETIGLPEGITFDSSPYGANQKIRMVGSNKDDENRPLRLIKGETVDTLISYCPESCTEFEFEMKDDSKVKEKPEKNPNRDLTGISSLSPLLLHRLVLNITNDESVSWETWYKVAQAIFNSGGTLDLFLEWSQKSPKHDEREAIQLWRGLKPKESGAALGPGSIFYWSGMSDLEAHENIILSCCDPFSYLYQKTKHERTHFKVKNPVCFIRETPDGKIQNLSEHDLITLYKPFLCDRGLFIKNWLIDPGMRTYESIVYAPKLDVPADCYNLFTRFAAPEIQDDEVVKEFQEVLYYICGKEQKVCEYVENYFADLIQNPGVKPGVALIFQSDRQGAGKDATLGLIGQILGPEYYINTNDTDNQLLGRFGGHLIRTLLAKVEEANLSHLFENQGKLLSTITNTESLVESKGKDPITVKNYTRYVFTTNKPNPIPIPESDRRFVAIKCSEDKIGNFDYWQKKHQNLYNKPGAPAALHYYLANKDISSFNIRNRPVTEYYRQLKLANAPYHVHFFRRWLELFGEVQAEETKTASEWLRDMNSHNRYQVSSTKFGLDMKEYSESGAFVKQRSKFSKSYTLHREALYNYLVEKGYWLEEV